MSKQFYSIKEMSSLPLPDEIIPGLLDDGISIIASGEGSGKTFFAIHCGIYIAANAVRELPWKGRKIKSGGVFYCAAEGLGFFSYRVYTAMFAAGFDPIYNPPFFMLTGSRNLMSLGGHSSKDVDDICTDMDRTLVEYPFSVEPRLVILDTLNRYMPGGDENKQQDAGAFIHGCETIRNRFGCAVMSLHHLARTGNLRGSTVLSGNVDQILHTSAEKGKLVHGPFKWTTEPEIGKRKDRDNVEEWFTAKSTPLLDFHGDYVFYDRENSVVEDTLVLEPIEKPVDADVHKPGKSEISWTLIQEIMENEPKGFQLRSLATAIRLAPSSTLRKLHGMSKYGYARQDESTKKWFSTGKKVEPYHHKST